MIIIIFIIIVIVVFIIITIIIIRIIIVIIGEYVWRSGESARLQPPGPGSILRPGVTCGSSLLLVLALASWVFLRVFCLSSFH